MLLTEMSPRSLKNQVREEEMTQDCGFSYRQTTTIPSKKQLKDSYEINQIHKVYENPLEQGPNTKLYKNWQETLK